MEFLSTDANGHLYGETRAKTKYISLHYHRSRTIEKKAIWHDDVKRLEEAEIFEKSEDGCWCDDAGNYWWTDLNLDKVLGIEGECYAFFPKRSNTSDPAHGYPVTGNRHAKRAVPENVARAWEAARHIRQVDRMRLKSRKI